MDKLPKVSVVIPARNEEKYIGKCLESLLNNDYPSKNIEIIVVDGMSEDNTRNIAEAISGVKIIENHLHFTPHGLNLGIKHSTGQIIMIASAHATYSKNYISECVKALNMGYDAAGGKMVTLPGDNSIKAKAISEVLAHPFGTGARYRTREFSNITEVDTVSYALYKKSVFEKLGGFNENLIRNQDIELSLRMKRAAKRIALVPSAKSFYYARSKFTSLFKNNFLNGFWVIWSTRFAKLPFSLRHLIPFFYILFLILGGIISTIFKPFSYLYFSILILYAILITSASLHISIKNKRFLLFPYAFWAFLTLHFSYGLGSFWAGVELLVSRREKS